MKRKFSLTVRRLRLVVPPDFCEAKLLGGTGTRRRAAATGLPNRTEHCRMEQPR